jgi:hypothetical protein
MKRNFIPAILLLPAVPSFSQYPLPFGSAGTLAGSGKTPEDKSYGM